MIIHWRNRYVNKIPKPSWVCYNISMSKILIIGNVLKDVYLKLDGHGNDFETDGQGINWLELGFNGEAHNFFRRTSVYGGAAVTLATLSKLGVDASILNSKTETKSGELLWSDEPTNYRYIFSYGGGITYFVPRERKATDWTMPSGTPEWILVDRSTIVTAKLVDEIRNFIKFSRNTKLAVHAEKKMTPDGQRLAEMADLLFLEDEPAVHIEEKIVDKIDIDKPNTQLVCHISPRRLVFGEAEEVWDLDRTDMMTHLTVYSTIVATVLGVIAAGGTPEDALLWARLNAEKATLDGSLSAEKLQELAAEERAKRDNLKLICRSLVTTSKGVLAVDESKKSLIRRFDKFGIRMTAQKKAEFYDLMLTLPDLKNYISGVILSEDNAKQKMPSGKRALEFLTDRGIISGIKADLGLAPMDKNAGETHTLGLDGLTRRLRDYYEQGFRFTKWRAAFSIGKDRPGFYAVEQNTDELAEFAKTCQLVGIVPVVEADIVRDGDFAIERSIEVTAKVLEVVFRKLQQRHVDLAGCVLKCNMVISGSEAEVQATSNEIGVATAAILKHAVPRYVGGVLLLSGGQEPKEATKNLTAVMQNSPFAWPISFAFSRALEEPVLATWKGESDNIRAAQAALIRHLEANIDALHYARVEGQNSIGDGNIAVLDLG